MRTVQQPRVVNFLYRWQWVPILLSAPLFAFSSWLPLIPLMIVPGLWIAIWLAGGKPLAITPLNLPILIIALMMMVSVFATYDLYISLGFLSGAVIGLGFYFMAAHYGKTSRGWWTIFFVFVGLSTLICAVDSLLISWPQKISLLNPITSLLKTPLVTLPVLSVPPHANNLPILLLSVIPIQVVLTGSILFRRKEWAMSFGRARTNGLTLLLVLSTLVNLLIFILAQSRGGYISLAITCIFLLFTASSPRFRWILIGGMLAGVLILIMLWSGRQLSPVQETYTNLSNDPSLSIDTLESRVEMWSRAIYGIQDFPFTGMGINTFGHIMPALYPVFSNSVEVSTNAHNAYLQVALDLGIPGLIAFLAVQLGTFWMWFKVWKIIRHWRSLPPGEPPLPTFGGFGFLARGIVLGLGGALLSLILIGLTEANALGTYLPIWVMTGLISALYNQSLVLKNEK